MKAVVVLLRGSEDVVRVSGSESESESEVLNVLKC